MLLLTFVTELLNMLNLHLKKKFLYLFQAKSVLRAGVLRLVMQADLCMEQEVLPRECRISLIPLSSRALKGNFLLALSNKVLYVPFSECKYCFFSKCHMKL